MKGERLFRRWFDLVDASPRMRHFILTELASPARHWHGLLHHALMLRIVTRARLNEADTRRLVLATLFHDIVYDATRTDNEERSAAIAQIWLTGTIADDVAELVLATKQHDLATDPLTRVLLEADLSVLWTTNRRLCASYARGIRHEYAHVPDAAYRAGRSAVLRELAAQLDPWIDQPRRACLRTNLSGEIARLAAGHHDLGR